MSQLRPMLDRMGRLIYVEVPDPPAAPVPDLRERLDVICGTCGEKHCFKSACRADFDARR